MEFRARGCLELRELPLFHFTGAWMARTRDSGERRGQKSDQGQAIKGSVPG